MIPSPIQSLMILSSKFQVQSSKFKVQSSRPKHSTFHLALGTLHSLYHRAHAPQVLFRVHADGRRGRFDDADSVAVFEDAELFERLGTFEHSLRPTRVF